LSGRPGRPARRYVARGIEHELVNAIPRVRRPGEVVHVLREVPIGRPGAGRTLRSELPGRTHDVRRGDVEGHVVTAVVGRELGVGVAGVAVPSAPRAPAHPGGLVDSDLREPLADEMEVPDESRAGEDARKLRTEGDRELDRAPRRNRCGERYREDGLVGGIVAV